MATSTTNGIQISVTPRYQEEYSVPSTHKYLYSYEVSIQNLGGETVQLISRHWTIFDSNGTYRKVDGEGVVGQQPILMPGEIHTYSSWCPLTTEFGRMKGHYIMQRANGTFFSVQIPPFNLIVPIKNN